MKYANAFAWIFTIVGIGFLWAHWPEVKWYLANKQTVDKAIDTADALKGILP